MMHWKINYRYGGRSLNLKTIIRTEGCGGILRMQVGNIEKAAPGLRERVKQKSDAFGRGDRRMKDVAGEREA